MKVATFDRAGPHGHAVEDVATMLEALISDWLILSVLPKGDARWSPHCSPPPDNRTQTPALERELDWATAGPAARVVNSKTASVRLIVFLRS